MKMDEAVMPAAGNVMSGMVEREEAGMIVLSPAQGRPVRRVLHVNSYGGRDVWERIKQGLLPGHQLLGCLELVRKGYEVALAEPLPDFYLYRKPLPHDLRLLKMARSWLGKDGILFCGHNVLYWIPLLKKLGAIPCPIVSLIYAREPLDFATAHAGIIALTPAGAEHAKKLAPRAKISNLGWGVDLGFFPRIPYNPEWLLSCGIANRDFATLCAAANKCGKPIRVICPGLPPGLNWPSTVTVIDGGSGWVTDKSKKITVRDVLRDHYPRSAGSLVIMKNDPTEYTANGFTNLIEALAVGQPVIVTRTGALPGEIDVEKAGCGLHVPPDDPDALAKAMVQLLADPARARAMGDKGRQLIETHYNTDRYADDLHKFFESL
jgi:glycosyltransferase involved in cell wall biosynthesis